jgi:hypothetical protein
LLSSFILLPSCVAQFSLASLLQNNAYATFMSNVAPEAEQTTGLPLEDERFPGFSEREEASAKGLISASNELHINEK